MKRFFVALLLALLPVPALAQFEALKLALCKKITADDARLKCYDAMFNDATNKTEGDKPKTPAKWLIEDSKSPIDDSPQVVASITGEPPDSLLVLRCKERKTEVAIIPGGYFFASDRAQVLIRINDLPPTTTNWSVSSNNKAVFAPAAGDFIRLLPDDAKLFVRLTGFQGKQADATFNIADVSSARERIAVACNWITPKSAKIK